MNRAHAFTVVSLLALSATTHAIAEPAPRSSREIASDLSRQALSVTYGRTDPDHIVNELIVIDTLATALGDEGWSARVTAVRGLIRFMAEHPDARDRIVHIRQDADSAFRRNRAPFGAAAAWIDSSVALGKVHEVFEWIESKCGDAQDRRSIGSVATQVIRVLSDHERYDLLECLPRSLLSHAESFIRSGMMTLKDQNDPNNPQRSRARANDGSDFLLTLILDDVSRTVGALHAGALVAGQPEDAQRIADRLLAEFDYPESRIALATHAQRAGVADERHDAWLREGLAAQEAEQARRAARSPWSIVDDDDSLRIPETERGRTVAEPPY